MKEFMTPKERWLAVLKRESPDRLPMDYWGTPEISEKLKKHFKCEDMEGVFKKLHIDHPVSIEPRYIGPEISWQSDVYGCKYRKVDYGTGSYSECINHPLAEFGSVEEIDKNYVWPSADWYDFSVLKKQVEGKDAYPISGGGSEPFLTYKYLRGDEQAFVDLIENSEIVEYCLDKMYSFCYEYTRRIYETVPGKVYITYVAEDLGGQEDLIYSPAQIKKFFIPWMTKMMGLVHQAGAYAFFHSDGAIRKIIPDMIKAGIDVLNPVQWRCKGMERVSLQRDFGEKIIFHGGVDNQQTLPFGTVEDVRKEVMENIEIFGKNGGYILAPCHNIQAITPVENIIAMYETGYKHS
ncbi:MAG: uroporphyrinogen-III decarboxylase-like protein [Candidatus Omnitrophica bacterium]|nr:uroporphyrinogen-III decarboxylase-like protein [Candidatus Omnitrophota bacterium]